MLFTFLLQGVGNMKKSAATAMLILLVLLISSTAFASLQWYKLFNDTYKPKTGSALSKAKCAICHTVTLAKDKTLNPYGKSLIGKKVDAASLKSIEKNDADKDGFSNITEIKAGTLPGDPKSKPTKK
jgi:hypothetical protein